MRAVRFGTNPLLRTGGPEIGDNVNGASVVRVPGWVKGAMGKYYMYFAHHHGQWIRLAYADRVEGPWKVHEGGALRSERSVFAGVSREHIASPDVHVDEGRKKLVMFYHGGYLAEDFLDGPALKKVGEDGGKLSESERMMYRQATAVAESEDGIAWKALPGLIGQVYWRRFEWDGRFYALAMPGVFYESSAADGVTGFRRLEIELFSPRMRHAAVLVEGDFLRVFYTDVGDSPERILKATVALDRDWRKWRVVGTETVLSPETEYEGVDLKVEASRRGFVAGRVRQLRDPCVFVDGDKKYLFYAGAGEQVMAGAELVN